MYELLGHWNIGQSNAVKVVLLKGLPFKNKSKSLAKTRKNKIDIIKKRPPVL